MTEANAGATRLAISQIFLEDAQFRHRGDPLGVAPDQKAPATPAQITMEISASEEGKGAAVRLRVVSDAAEALYFYSVSYIVLFAVDFEPGAMPDTLRDRLLVTGSSMAYPFVREAVANLSMRARHGPTWLAPVNFAEIVRNNRMAERAEAASPTP